MMRLRLIAVAACLAVPLISHAQLAVSLHARTAGELAAMCGANPREAGADARINYCHGFAQGVVDVELARAGEKKPFCFPTPAPTRTAALRQFVEWVRGQPERTNLRPVDGLMQFLGERYPCK